MRSWGRKGGVQMLPQTCLLFLPTAAVLFLQGISLRHTFYWLQSTVFKEMLSRVTILCRRHCFLLIVEDPSKLVRLEKRIAVC